MINKFTAKSYSESRASYHTDGSKITVYVDNIWRDTQNFEAFIEGLNVVYLTEILCMNSKTPDYPYALCIDNGKTKNNCLFLAGAKKALYSNYTLFKND